MPRAKVRICSSGRPPYGTCPWSAKIENTLARLATSERIENGETADAGVKHGNRAIPVVTQRRQTRFVVDGVQCKRDGHGPSTVCVNTHIP